MAGACADQHLDLFGRNRRPLRKGPHFACDHGKPAARIARPCGLDPGVQGQQVGLKRNVVNHPDDLRDLGRGCLDLVHRGHRTLDHPSAFLHIVAGFEHDRLDLFGAFGRRCDACRHLLQGCCGFFQRGRLGFGPRSQIFRRTPDIDRPGPDAFAGRHDLADHPAQLIDRGVEILAQRIMVGTEGRVDPVAEVAGGEVAQTLAQTGDHQAHVRLQPGVLRDRGLNPVRHPVDVAGDSANVIVAGDLADLDR